MNRIEKLFSEHFEPGYYKLIDITHPLSLYIGLDAKGHFSFEFKGEFKPEKVKSLTAIGVEHYDEKGEKKVLVFSLLDSTMLSTFCAFCQDLLDCTFSATDDKNGYSILLNRFYGWRKMFHQANHNMDEHGIMGLIGELLFLRNYMIPTFGKAKALNSWTGSEMTRKDFSVDDTWFEVKAITKGKLVVTISSYEQLDSDKEGELVIYQLEKMSPEFDGVSLNKLVKKIYGELGIDALRDVFLQKLSDRAYKFESAYDNFVYATPTMDRYEVSADFPCLRRDDKLDAISQVKYDLLLTKIEKYKK